MLANWGFILILKAAGDKLLMNKFIRQNFGGGLTLKNFKYERLGANSVVAWENSRRFPRSSLEHSQNDVWVPSAEIPYWWRVTTQI